MFIVKIATKDVAIFFIKERRGSPSNHKSCLKKNSENHNINLIVFSKKNRVMIKMSLEGTGK